MPSKKQLEERAAAARSYAATLSEAHAAADTAVRAEIEREPEDQYALDCGFAWVQIDDGSHPFVRWCREAFKTSGDRKLGGKGYPKGWKFWCPGNFAGQSVRVWRKGAEAFSDVLQRAGVPSVAQSRLD